MVIMNSVPMSTAVITVLLFLLWALIVLKDSKCPIALSSMITFMRINKETQQRHRVSSSAKRKKRRCRQSTTTRNLSARRLNAINKHLKTNQHEHGEVFYYIPGTALCGFKCHKFFGVRKQCRPLSARRRRVRRHIARELSRRHAAKKSRKIDKTFRNLLRAARILPRTLNESAVETNKSTTDADIINDEHIQIFIGGVNKKTYTIYVDPIHESVSFLKEQVAKMTHLDYDEFYLTFNGKPLKEVLLLKNYCLHVNATVEVNLRCLGGVTTRNISFAGKELPTHEDIRDCINNSFNKLFYVDDDGNRKPYVCAVCDEFIDNKQDNMKTLLLSDIYGGKEKLSWSTYFKSSERITELEEQYRPPVLDSLHKYGIPPEASNLEWINELALSPRSSILTCNGGRSSERIGLSCCKRCKRAMARDTENKYYSQAIANHNCVGATPDCLNELTEVELGLITPLKSYGFCFTYTGGKQRNLNGTLVYMRVPKRDIVRGVMQLEALGLNKNVIVISSGKMTAEQHERIKAKSKIRTDKVIAAVEWLCNNNTSWKEKANIDDIRNQLQGIQPTFIDHSKMEDSEDSNIETSEVFSCYFPDYSTSNNNGGFEKPGEFKKFVEQMQEQHAEIEFVHNLQKDYMQENRADEFVEGCLLQFPYGIGGVRQRRLTSEGKVTHGKKTEEIDAFIFHMTQMSQPQFHHPLFLLMLYNLSMKCKLLNRAYLQVPNNVRASNIANGLTLEDLTRAAEHRRNGRRTMGTQASQKILNSVEACSRAVPHTNEAATNARSTGESLQHHFGTGSIFLTVTYDDENSILVQVMSRQIVDDGKDVSSLSDKELEKKLGERRDLRLKFPGITALSYEMLNRILFRDVIGWDMDKCEPTEKIGIFGRCIAVALAVEEQGRKTLHGHYTIWIEGYNEMLDKVHNGPRVMQRREAEKEVCEYVNHANTTKLFHTANQRELQEAFDHSCKETISRKRKLPDVVEFQQLRNLRHRHGFRETMGKFASCQHCGKTWTYEELLADFLMKGKNIHEAGVLPSEIDSKEIPLARLKAMIVEYQASRNRNILPEVVVNATYQHHKSCHVRGCFACSGKRKHVCGPSCECRFRLPDCKRKKTKNVRQISETTQNWFAWTGENKPRHLIELLPTRGTFDLFQNVSCSAISSSKFACNNNCAPITPGPLSQYMFKYNFKKTQKDDTADYEYVLNRMKTCLMTRKHDNDRNEARRLILAAAFAHQKSNIIGASMASYIMRNDSRFYFSHKFAYCPLRDIVRILDDEPISGTLQSTVGVGKKPVTYFENCAFDYLCRNAEHLEEVSVSEFYAKYVSTKNNEKDDGVVFGMEEDTGHYQHPSAYTGTVHKTVKQADESRLLKVSQWEFPDTATFQGDMLSRNTPPNEAMDKYARLVLILFLPFRCAEDLKAGTGEFAHVAKLRQIYAEDERRKKEGEAPIVFTGFAKRFLQNIQDARANCLRRPTTKDELQSKTNQFEHSGCPNEESDEEEQPEEEYDIDLENVFNWLDATDDTTNNEEQHAIPKKFRLTEQRDQGKQQAGHNRHMRPAPTIKSSRPFFQNVAASRSETNSNDGSANSSETRNKKYSMKSLVNILFRTRDVNAAATSELFGNRASQVLLANGSAKSIINWAETSGLDSAQKRAFEVIISAFLLTFYDDADGTSAFDNAASESDDTSNVRTKYRVTCNNLKTLRGIDGPNLICLLHGPGGSGKSTVINLVKAYAKEFCSTLGHDYTHRTITITAMSGVAATLINGETTHKALGLNKRKEFTEDEKEVFVDTRLIIIDEISFAGKRDFEKIDRNVRLLKSASLDQSRGHLYGGVNMVFAGDYSQLEPVNAQTIYDDDSCPVFQHAVNCYIELDGMHRFSEDMEWGRLLRRFREGKITIDDIRLINSRCHVQGRDVPSGVQAACFGNKERNAINSLVFDQYCKANKPLHGNVVENAALVFMDELHSLNADKIYKPIRGNSFRQHFYENCGDATIECNNRSALVDSVLKLYPQCPLMMTENTNVSAGQANGSRLNLLQIKKKSGEEPQYVELDNGLKVPAYTANQIESLLVEHSAANVTPKIFEVKSKNYSFTAKMPDGIGSNIKVSMQGTQFPLVSNSATTGHKLQGSTVKTLLVNDWRYQSNWVYVVLSRVKKMQGLFIRSPLSEDISKYDLPENMLRMIGRFKETQLVQTLPDATYQRMKNE